jgi:FkbM family methyltransferase
MDGSHNYQAMTPDLETLAADRGLTVSERSDYLSIGREGREIRIHPRHAVYLRNMLADFDFWHSSVVPQNVDGVAVVDFTQPRVHRLVGSGVEFEFPSLAESDKGTEIYMEAMNPQPGEIVFDLGAYAGASSYFFSQAVGPEGLVVAFEPDAMNFACLQRNIARHGLMNVRAINKGVWRETTTLTLEADGNMGSGATELLDRFTNIKLVPVLTLADAAALCGGRRVASIKMDIEGAEVPVLQSSGDFLREHRPALIIEPHFVRQQMNTEPICEILKSYGYQVRLVAQGVCDWQNANDWPLIAARF